MYFRIGTNWNCPYCGHAQVIAEERLDADLNRLNVEKWVEGLAGYQIEAIVCANAECRKLSVEFAILRRGKDIHQNGGKFEVNGVFQQWRLLPSTIAKPLPDYIPKPLRHDYEEACAIRDLSPKASATLIRRCIQGIIRDFCGIVEKRLVDEINKLRQRINAGHAPAGVQADTVDAIDHVRQIGNIGAHMEADINVIIDVDPDEAQRLIELAELLFDEWYTGREQRTQRSQNLASLLGKRRGFNSKNRFRPSLEPIPARHKSLVCRCAKIKNYAHRAPTLF